MYKISNPSFRTLIIQDVRPITSESERSLQSLSQSADTDRQKVVRGLNFTAFMNTISTKKISLRGGATSMNYSNRITIGIVLGLSFVVFTNAADIQEKTTHSNSSWYNKACTAIDEKVIQPAIKYDITRRASLALAGSALACAILWRNDNFHWKPFRDLVGYSPHLTLTPRFPENTYTLDPAYHEKYPINGFGHTALAGVRFVDTHVPLILGSAALLYLVTERKRITTYLGQKFNNLNNFFKTQLQLGR